MESGQHCDANEPTTTNGNTNSIQGDASTCKPDTDPGGILKNVQNVTYIYRQDVVRNKSNSKIGIVTEVAGDSDSDSTTSDDEDEEEDEKDDEVGFTHEGAVESDRNVDDNAVVNTDDNEYDHVILKPDHVRVLWIDDSETTESTDGVTVIDRGFLHGDYVAAASDPAGQIGIVVDVDITVDLLRPEGSVIKDMPSRDLKRIRDFDVGDHVVLGPWLGRIEDVADNVTVLFDDGSVCKVMKADPLQLKAVEKNILDDDHSPYYPGQRVKASTSSVFKNSRWLSGLWKANRLEGTVAKVTVGSVYIYWIASAGYGPDSATTPCEEQSPMNLKMLSCFTHTNWQLCDWCLPPSSPMSESMPLDKRLLKSESHNSAKDEPKSTETADDSDFEVSTTHESVTDNKLIENNLEASLDKNTELPEATVSSLTEGLHDARPVRKKIRKVVVRKDKKSRKKIENFERALLIINTKTKVDVAWQDGTIKQGLDSTSLISIESPGDHDFVSEQYVVEKAADDNNDDVSIRHVGVVKSVDAKDRTACVRWLKTIPRAEDPREFDKEEVVSVYELEGHPDYDYCYGDVVVRLLPVSLPANMESSLSSIEVGTQNSLDESMNGEGVKERSKNVEFAFGDDMCTEFTDLSWVGNITALKDGDIEVTWADGMISMVGPQAIYVVGRDDDYSMAAGSDASDDAASWETLEDDNMDTLDNGIEEQETEHSYRDIMIEDTNVAAEKSESNGTLSLPYAALGFLTKLASGIFSMGQTHSDPLNSESKSGDDLHSEKTLNRQSGSPKSDDIESRFSKLTTDIKEERCDLDIAETQYKLKQQNLDAPCYEFMPMFKGFDIVNDPSDHYFVGAQEQNNAARKWLKKVQQDWGILQKNLPEGICVRVYEDRMDLLRAVIVGPYGVTEHLTRMVFSSLIFTFHQNIPMFHPQHIIILEGGE